VIQANTGGAVEAIGGIKGVIDKISQISTEIATRSRSRAQPPARCRGIGGSGAGSDDDLEQHPRVAEAAQNTSTNVGEAQTATEHLARMANQLRDQVGRFRVGAGSPKPPGEDR